jgi:hypothetical protein
MTKMVRRSTVIQLLSSQGQSEEERLLSSPNVEGWKGRMVEIVLASGYKFIGTILSVAETHVITDYGTAKKDQISYVRVMQDEEVRVRKGLNQ